MDTITHIVLGACIAEVVAGKQLGKKALLIGAFAQNVPDFDFVASSWLPVSADLLAHRGFTHSFAFLAIFAPLLGLASFYLFRKTRYSLQSWILFWALQLFVHIFIDAFNAYGTGWFEPFSHYRVSFNTLFVADPLFTIWPGLCFIALLLFRRGNSARKTLAAGALSICVLYLLGSIMFKLSVDNTLKKNLEDKHISATSYFTTPTPLNDLLWYMVVKNDSGYYIGYRSVLDKTGNVDFHFVYRNDSLLTPYRNSTDLKNLLRFSRGYYTANVHQDTLAFNDLCFGEINGWTNPHPPFVFYYYLQYPEHNKLVVQRGRFAAWNKKTIGAFIARIAGI